MDTGSTPLNQQRVELQTKGDISAEKKAPAENSTGTKEGWKQWKLSAGSLGLIAKTCGVVNLFPGFEEINGVGD